MERLNGLLANPANEALVKWFDGFHDELRASINEPVTREVATDMVAQRILTRSVLDVLFEDSDFAAGNPVARALEGLRAYETPWSSAASRSPYPSASVRKHGSMGAQLWAGVAKLATARDLRSGGESRSGIPRRTR